MYTYIYHPTPPPLSTVSAKVTPRALGGAGVSEVP